MGREDRRSHLGTFVSFAASPSRRFIVFIADDTEKVCASVPHVGWRRAHIPRRSRVMRSGLYLQPRTESTCKMSLLLLPGTSGHE